MKLKKRSNEAKPQQLVPGNALTRREFLRSSGLMAGGTALGLGLHPAMMCRADATTSEPGTAQQIRTICTHCSVGCGIIAEVHNGVWTGQEPAFDHPFCRGAHCAKGASVREHGHGE
ncbi:MAG: formate dehydrogenase, partial [Gammaproteobacteria bacterium]|nr:formate dehydrogenase [Gammaproteobacteria bacterium]